MKKIMSMLATAVFAVVAGVNAYLASGAASAAQSKVSDLTLEAIAEYRHGTDNGLEWGIYVHDGNPWASLFVSEDCLGDDTRYCSLSVHLQVYDLKGEYWKHMIPNPWFQYQ